MKPLLAFVVASGSGASVSRAVSVDATVDRVEGPMAVLEWPDGDFSDFPVAFLPPGTREGDRMRVHLRTQPTVRPGRASGPFAARLNGVAESGSSQ